MTVPTLFLIPYAMNESIVLFNDYNKKYTFMVCSIDGRHQFRILVSKPEGKRISRRIIRG
jgi:hypothetical protein